MKAFLRLQLLRVINMYRLVHNDSIHISIVSTFNLNKFGRYVIGTSMYLLMLVVLFIMVQVSMPLILVFSKYDENIGF